MRWNVIYSNIDFTVKYLDPSAESSGDGLSPVTAMNAFPATIEEFENNTAWIIRRTAETSSVLIPQGSSALLKNILLIGMPKSSDRFWSIVPGEAQTSWGADEPEYANIRADTGNDWYEENNSFSLTDARTFIMHRIYLFRDNTPAYGPIFKFPDENHLAHISLEKCKLGAKGIDLNLGSFTDAVTATYCGAYFHIGKADVFSMQDCIVNVASGSDNYYGGSYNPVYLKNANFVSVSNIDVYTATRQYGSDYGGGTALCFSDGSSEGAFADYQDIRFHIIVNDSFGYIPGLFYSNDDSYCRIRNMSAEIIERGLGTASPTLMSIDQPLIRCHSCREFEIENITVSLPGCWRIDSAGRVVSITGWCNSNIPGHAKYVRNITIQMEENNGVDSEHLNGNYYDRVKYGTTDIGQYPYYSALELSFSERNYAEGAWEPVLVSGITVNHPHGVALYGYGFQLRNCSLEGTLKLRRCIADITAVSTFYPGYAIFAAEATTMKIGALTLGKDNAHITGGADDPAIGSRYSDSSFVYVGTANGALKSNIGETSTNVDNCYNFICGNEVDTGHYTCRANNYICDTWNVHRNGGSPAVWKFISSADGTGTMSLGRAPFKGIQISPTATGMHSLSMHIATKGLTSIEEMNRLLTLEVAVPQVNGGKKIFFSPVHGQWLDDSATVWENDSELTQLKLVMPLDIPVIGEALDIKIHYRLYSATGYVYIDPVMELTAEA